MARVAVIGAGIAGLAAAWRLQQSGRHRVTLFEAGSHFGGHAHTVAVQLPDRDGRLVEHGVDTGFLVFNPRTYPGLVRLFDTLGVPTARSDMSFSVQSRNGLVWSGRNLNALFAQRRNLVRPAFWQLLREVHRFNRLATDLVRTGHADATGQPLDDFLRRHAFGPHFRDGYLLPMVACIWSCPTDQMLRFPVATLLRFCDNHGLLQATGQPPWYTVRGGAARYIERIVASLPDARLDAPVTRVRRLPHGIWLGTPQRGDERFDAVVFACHSDQALRLLGPQASDDERRVLGAIRYRPNEAVLHTDTAVLPALQRAWAAWNYEQATDATAERQGVCLHYWLNRLQPLPFGNDVVVSLNPLRAPHNDHVLGRWTYHHPVFDADAIAAQAAVPALQGRWRSWFCGAWTGHGFHEDGLRSGFEVAAAVDRDDDLLLAGTQGLS